MSIYEIIGVFYVVVATAAFTVGAGYAAVKGLVLADRLIERGSLEENRDIQMALAMRDDITKAELSASQDKRGRKLEAENA